MANVLFISTNYVKENTIIDENVDAKYLKYAILKAQDIQLQEILGTDLYNDIKDEVEAASVSSANQTLLDNYIVPYLTEQVVVEATVPMQFKHRNKAIMTMTSEEAQAITTQDISLVYKHYANRSQYYGERLRKYLVENSTTYPLWLNGNSEAWKIRPTRTAYQTGLFLGRQRKPLQGYRGFSALNDEDWFTRDYCCYK